MSILFCDTNCELWYTRAQELSLNVIRMPYTLDGKEYLFDLGKETDFQKFYSKVRNKSQPTTAALNEYDYINYFEPILSSGQDIFYIAFSHQLSNTFEYMNNAIKTLKEKYPNRKITVFDTNSISMGTGLQVLYGAKKWREGATDEELYSYLEEFTKHVSTYFAVDNLFHLKRGGRLSGAAATVGTVLKIKPILQIGDDGKLTPKYKVKGSKNVIQKLFSLYEEFGDKSGDYEVFVLHADREKDASELVTKLKELTKGKVRINLQFIGPVIGTHCGPDTLGLIFYGKHR